MSIDMILSIRLALEEINNNDGIFFDQLFPMGFFDAPVASQTHILSCLCPNNHLLLFRLLMVSELPITFPKYVAVMTYLYRTRNVNRRKIIEFIMDIIESWPLSDDSADVVTEALSFIHEMGGDFSKEEATTALTAISEHSYPQSWLKIVRNWRRIAEQRIIRASDIQYYCYCNTPDGDKVGLLRGT